MPAAVSGSLGQDFSPAYLRTAIERSLRRLRTDYLDLYQLHSPPTSIVSAGDWVETLDGLKRQGKIRYYGVSCDSPDAAYAALAHGGVSSLQLSISLLVRDAVPVLPAARERGVGVIARETLANGLLIKDAADLDVRAHVQTDEEAVAKSAQIARYRHVAAGHGCTLPQLALQFVRQLEGVSVSLLGVSSLEQLNRLLERGLPSDACPQPEAIADLA
jgi:aryl-alcohol dehydrogenase-like predicted oxidoreductase